MPDVSHAPKTVISRRRALEIAASLVNESGLEGQLQLAKPSIEGFAVDFEKIGSSGRICAGLIVALRTTESRVAVGTHIKLYGYRYSIGSISTLRALLYDLLVLGSFVQQSLERFDIVDPN